MKIDNLETLTIHKLSDEQYQREIDAGTIDETAIYLTPKEEVKIDIATEINEDASDAFAASAKAVYDFVTDGLDGIGIADWDQNDPDGEGYIKNKPFYITTEGGKLVLSQSEIIDGEAQWSLIKFNTDLVAGKTYNVTFKMSPVLSGQTYTATLPIMAKKYSSILAEMGATLPNNAVDFMALYCPEGSIEFTGYDSAKRITFMLLTNVDASANKQSPPTELIEGIASYCMIYAGEIEEGYIFTAELDDNIETIHKIDTKFINTSDKISENSTEEELATAKDVYDTIQDVYGAVHELEDKIGSDTTIETINFVPYLYSGKTSMRDANGNVLFAELALDPAETYKVILDMSDGTTKEADIVRAAEGEDSLTTLCSVFDTLVFEDQWKTNFTTIFDELTTTKNLLKDKLKLYTIQYNSETAGMLYHNFCLVENGTGMELDDRPTYQLFERGTTMFWPGAIDGVTVVSATLTCPIVKIEHQNPDWEQFDPTSLSYIKNKPFGSVLFSNYNTENSLIYDNRAGQGYNFTLNDRNILVYDVPTSLPQLFLEGTEAFKKSSYAQNGLYVALDKFRFSVELCIPQGSKYGSRTVKIRGNSCITKSEWIYSNGTSTRYIKEAYLGNMSLMEADQLDTGEDYLFYFYFESEDSASNKCSIYLKPDATLFVPCECRDKVHDPEEVKIADYISYMTGSATTSIFKRLVVKFGIPDVEYKTIPEQFLPESVKNDKVQCIKDWEENDPNSLSYIQNRPFYEETTSKTIPLELDFVTGSKNFDSTFDIVVGEEYELTAMLADGTTRILKATAAADVAGLTGTVGVGFSFFINESQTDWYEDDRCTISIFNNCIVTSDNTFEKADGKSCIHSINRIEKNPNLIDKAIVSAQLALRPAELKKLNTKFINTVSEISENVTDEQLPTAKAVYDYVKDNAGGNAGNGVADWAQTDPAGEGYIKNKPCAKELTTVTFTKSGSEHLNLNIIPNETYNLKVTYVNGTVTTIPMVALPETVEYYDSKHDDYYYLANSELKLSTRRDNELTAYTELHADSNKCVCFIRMQDADDFFMILNNIGVDEYKSPYLDFGNTYCWMSDGIESIEIVCEKYHRLTAEYQAVSDWNETNPEKPGYIKNRPFYHVETKTETDSRIIYDSETDGEKLVYIEDPDSGVLVNQPNESIYKLIDHYGQDSRIKLKIPTKVSDSGEVLAYTTLTKEFKTRGYYSGYGENGDQVGLNGGAIGDHDSYAGDISLKYSYLESEADTDADFLFYQDKDNNHVVYFYIKDDALCDNGLPIGAYYDLVLQHEIAFTAERVEYDERTYFKELSMEFLPEELFDKLEELEKTENKVSTITGDENWKEYPTAQAVKNYVDAKMEELKLYIAEQIQAALYIDKDDTV